MLTYTCVCVCVFIPMQPAGFALQPRPGGSAVRQRGLSRGNCAGFSSAEIPLRGNILHYHWREDKQSKRWRRKSWAFNRFPRLLTSPVQQSICKTLEVVHLVHIVAAFLDLYRLEAMTKKRCFCVENIGKTCSKTDPDTRQPAQENKGAVKSCTGNLYPLKLLKRNEALNSTTYFCFLFDMDEWRHALSRCHHQMHCNLRSFREQIPVPRLHNLLKLLFQY